MGVLNKYFGKLIPDKLFLKLLYRKRMGQWPNFSNPKSFNEKIQWLKLNDRKQEYSCLVDKIKVKRVISEKIGDEHVLPILGVWDNADDVEIEDLPNSFVLKTNHDCGGVVLCSDKNTFDLEDAKSVLRIHLNRNYYWSSREWPYRFVTPRVFAEEYLQPDDDLGLKDYKMFTFSNGRIITLVCENRFGSQGMSETFFDEEWNWLDITEGDHGVNPSCRKPAYFEEMKNAAKILSEGVAFLRVDFFEAKNQFYCGELTFYPNSGFEKFIPNSWNEVFGGWISLDRTILAKG